MMEIVRLASVTDSIDDPEKVGWIKVVYRNEVQWAKPCFPFGNFWVPTKEWLEKYGQDVYVVVGKAQGVGGDYLIWLGMMFHDGKAPVQTSTDYPYVRWTFTENWEMEAHDTPGALRLSLKRNDNKLVIVADNSGFKLTVEDGYVIIDNDDVHLGGSAGEKAVMGESWMTRFNTHTHIGNHGAMTSTPIGKMTSAQLSDKVKVVK